VTAPAAERERATARSCAAGSQAGNGIAHGRVPALRRFLGFGAVGMSGLAPNLVVMWLCADLLRIHYTVSAVVAHQVATSWNFALSDRLVFRGRGVDRWHRRYGWFMLSGNADLAVRLPFLMVLVSVARLNHLAGTTIVIGALFLLRFAVADRMIYRVPLPAKNRSHGAGPGGNSPHGGDGGDPAHRPAAHAGGDPRGRAGDPAAAAPMGGVPGQGEGPGRHRGPRPFVSAPRVRAPHGSSR
jgi:putative flippase GtrA